MLLIDTNVWLSAADDRSPRYTESASLLADHEGELAATVPVIAETSWLILARLGPESHSSFLRMAVTGELERVDLTQQDWERVSALCVQYADLRLDAIDASMIAVAERLGLDTVATYNHRDFRVVRPRHVEAFQLLP